MSKRYTDEEKALVLQELQIMPIEGMVDSRQAALILSKRAEIETGTPHPYRDDAIRWRVKTGKLPIARAIHARTKLFWVDDIFALDLEPQKWWSEEKRTALSKRGVKKGETDELDGQKISVTPHLEQGFTASLVA